MSATRTSIAQLPLRTRNHLSRSANITIDSDKICHNIRRNEPAFPRLRSLQTDARPSSYGRRRNARSHANEFLICRHFATTSLNPASKGTGPDRVAGSPGSFARDKLKSRDRGPASTEDTQTDFGELNVLGGITAPSTSVDTCLFDGFQLDSGLQVGDGDGVMLVGGEGFVWRPWMASRANDSNTGNASTKSVINGAMMKGATEVERSGGVINSSGQFEVTDAAWGVFSMLWPRPDLLIIGTGPTIRPLAPATKSYLQQLGMRLEVLDTRNAASSFNMLATERGVSEVAAALVPIGFGLK